MSFGAVRTATVGTHYNPVKVHFGWNAVDNLRDVVRSRKVLLLTFPEADCAGLFHRLRESLGTEPWTKWFIACPEAPTYNEFRGLYRRVRNLVVDREVVIVAVGGGSVIDVAKIASLSKSEEEFSELFNNRIIQGKPIQWMRHAPVIAVPTTAGTGSEVTRFATVWDHRSNKGYSATGQSLWPEAAIVDPSLTTTCPRTVTRNCALDALAHAFESIWNTRHNPVSDALAVSAARGILTTLPVVLDAQGEWGHRQNAHEEARAQRTALSAASLRAGLAFSNTGTALAHELSYRITIERGVKHGVAASFALPRVLSLALRRDADRDAVMSQVFAGLTTEDPPAFLDSWLRRMGVSTDLNDYGIKGEEEMRARVADAVCQRNGRRFVAASAIGGSCIGAGADDHMPEGFNDQDDDMIGH